MTPSEQESLLRLLTQVRAGELSIESAAAEITARRPDQASRPDQAKRTSASPLSENTRDACVDLDRQARCGFPEVVYCEGKTAESIEAIFRKLIEHNQDCLGTRVNERQAAHLTAAFPNAIANPIARTVRVQLNTDQRECGEALVIAAGTTDRPVAEEALETLRWMRVPTKLILDVGVAGPHRLDQHVARLQSAAAIVVCAGMEGALPSVVGGHVSCPVIGVPTSVGYGANFGGVSALLSILNSCASNVLAVNIDAGFKGGYVAGLIATGKSDPL